LEPTPEIVGIEGNGFQEWMGSDSGYWWNRWELIPGAESVP